MRFALAGLAFFAIAGLWPRTVRPQPNGGPAPGPARPANDVCVALAALLTVGSFFFWLHAIDLAARTQTPFRSWYGALPLLAIDDRAPLFGHVPFGTDAGLAAVFECLGLCGLFFTLRERTARPRTWANLAIAFLALAAGALASHAVTSFDMYAYAGGAHAGVFGGYHPAKIPFTGDWAAINDIYGCPIVPSPYGPVWLLLGYVAAALGHSLAGTLFVLRSLELLALAACVAALHELRVRAHALAMFALNPALFANFVVDGHNDMVAVALVLGAAALYRRAPLAAVLLAACAGGIKLPFLAIAPLAFAVEAAPRKRLAYAAAALTGGIVVSAAFGGAGYIAAVRATVGIYRETLSDPVTDALRLALVAAALAGVALALARRRFVPTLAWTFVAFGTSLFSWYLVWGIPYAVAERRWLPAFLASLPLLGFVLATSYAPTVFANVAFHLVVFASPVVVLIVLRREYVSPPVRPILTA